MEEEHFHEQLASIEKSYFTKRKLLEKHLAKYFLSLLQDNQNLEDTFYCMAAFTQYHFSEPMEEVLRITAELESYSERELLEQHSESWNRIKSLLEHISNF